MAHRYSQPITALAETANAAHPLCALRAFAWRGRDYTVCAVLAHWHLEARWWEATPSASRLGTSPTASDRYYYRLACMPDDLLCEVYYDACGDQWVLDVVYD